MKLEDFIVEIINHGWEFTKSKQGCITLIHPNHEEELLVSIPFNHVTLQVNDEPVESMSREEFIGTKVVKEHTPDPETVKKILEENDPINNLSESEREILIKLKKKF